MNDPYLHLRVISMEAEIYFLAKACVCLQRKMNDENSAQNSFYIRQFFIKFARLETLQAALKALGVTEEYTNL